MTTQTVTPSKLAQGRASLYQLLAEVYAAPPAVDFLKFLAGWAASVGGAEASTHLLSEQMAGSLEALVGFFNAATQGKDWARLAETASGEFTRLFRGVRRDCSPLPPYESSYREEGGRVFGESTAEVHRTYGSFGLNLTDRLPGEPPDHLSFELDFMRFLCTQEATAWESHNPGDALRFLLAEQEFLRDHLMAWLPRFCNEVREYDRLGLFRNLADLTEGWVTSDYEQHLHGEANPAELVDGVTGLAMD